MRCKHKAPSCYSLHVPSSRPCSISRASPAHTALWWVVSIDAYLLGTCSLLQYELESMVLPLIKVKVGGSCLQLVNCNTVSTTFIIRLPVYFYAWEIFLDLLLSKEMRLLGRFYEKPTSNVKWTKFSTLPRDWKRYSCVSFIFRF